MRCLFRICFLVLVCAASAHAESLKIFSFRLPLIMSDPKGVVPLARGQEIEDSLTALLGQGGALTLDGENGSRISVIGPAQIRFANDGAVRLVTLDYGEVYFKGTGSFAGKIEGPGFSELARGLEFFFDGSPLGVLRISNIGRSFSVYGEPLRRGETLNVKGKTRWHLVSDEAELSFVKRRFTNNRHLEELSGEVKVEFSAFENEHLKGFWDMGPVLGVSRLSPAAGSSFVQDLAAVGVFGRYGSNVYFDLPIEARRTHYLNAPSLRFGFDTLIISAWLGPSAESQFRTFLIGLAPFVGWGWRGVFVDINLAYMRLIKFGGNAFALRRPYSYGGVIGTRFDLAEYMDAEAGLTLGARYFQVPMAPESASSAEASSVTPDYFTWHLLSLELGLSFRF